MKKKKLHPGQAGIFVLLSLWALTTIYPIIWVVLNSFKDKKIIVSDSFSLPLGERFSMDNYRLAFGRLDLLNNLVIAGMMFPVFATIIPVFQLMARWGIVNTPVLWKSLLATALPQIAGNMSFAIVVLSGYIKGLPVELEEAAYMEGANIFQIFGKVIMPLSKPSFATVGIFSFLWSYNDLFTQTFMLRGNQYGITRLLNELTSREGTNYGLMAAAVTLVVIPILIVYIFLQKYIIKGMTAGAIKG